MSEVQKILDDTLCGFALAVGQGNGTINENLTETKQALYDLLMEKMPKTLNSTMKDDVGHSFAVQGHNGAVRQMKSAINELFGRTE